MKYIKQIFLLIIVMIGAIYITAFTFNHISAWIGVVVGLGSIYFIIYLIINKFKKLYNEKN
jgi:hypothetical protein